jgi:hypothetical protein
LISVQFFLFLLRTQAMRLVEKLAEVKEESVRSLIFAHKDALHESVPPRKNLLRQHDPSAQVGILEANLFVAKLTPTVVVYGNARQMC